MTASPRSLDADNSCADASDQAIDVIFIAHDIGGSGGMERQSSQLIHDLVGAGVRLLVLARTCELDEDVTVRLLKIRTPPRPFLVAYPAFALMASWEVWKLRRRWPQAVVHSTGALLLTYSHVVSVHYCHAAPGARASRRGFGKTWLHRCYAALAAWMSRAGERFAYSPRRSGMLCAVSKGLERELRHAFPRMADLIKTIPNGVDTERFRPDQESRASSRRRFGIPEDPLLAVFVGGDWLRKGLPLLIGALKAAPDWSLAIAGAGDTTVFAGSPSSDRIHFLGRVLEPEAVYAMADAFVLPSLYETFSLVTFEAAAAGLPLLVTRVNGPDELIVDGANGWFITPDARDIARRLNQLASAPALRERMGRNARQSAMAFPWSSVSKGYLETYARFGVPDRRPVTTITAPLPPSR